MNKQPAVTEQTRKNLQDAFWGLYVEKPIAKISVKEITTRAGYNRGTFYLYYDDVYDMLDRIEAELLGKIRALFEERVVKDGRPDIEGNMSFILETANDYDRDRLTVLLGDKGDPKFKSQFKELIWPLVAAYLAPEGAYSPSEERIAKRFFLSGLISAIVAWLEDDRGMPLDKFIELIMHRIVRIG